MTKLELGNPNKSSVAKANKPWEGKWKIVEPLPGGGQCNNYVVTSTLANPSSSETVASHVLKVIKDETNYERRARFHREVHTYINLIHPAIPKIVDHNCFGLLDGQEKLYFVYPYIDGPNLEEFVTKKGAHSIVDSFSLTTKLAEVLSFIHERDIIHRDIKPDNIILRNGDICDPVLIDFGLSVGLSDEVLQDSLIKQLGNRFLYLPELKLGNSNKRDKRSDITYLVGILYYVLTKELPAHLVDENSKYPHQRVDWKVLQSSDYKDRFHLIMRLFDIGFHHQLNSRFQSIDHFIELLDKIKKIKMEDSFDFKSYLKDSSNPDLLSIEATLRAMYKKFLSVFMYPVRQIESDFPGINMRYSGPSVHPHFVPMAIIRSYYPTDKFNSELKTHVSIKLYPNGSEYLIAAIIRGNETVFERFQKIDELNVKEVGEKIMNHVLEDFATMKKGK